MQKIHYNLTILNFRSTYITSKGNPTLYGILYIIEEIITIIFTVDYAIHIYHAKNKISYMFSIHSIIDIFAILPFYIHKIIGDFSSALGFLHIL
jgi:hypothetical protein